MLADAETLRNLSNRIASLRDLAHRVTLKLFAEIRFAHDALLASKLGKKASTNLGAIQVDHFRRINDDSLMGLMTMRDDDRFYVFELERVIDPTALVQNLPVG
ncbi:DUF4334 domain-containing protein [Ensifer adhaerens]|uniref:DUF4334 domain-containing protein n=1 Tax=Ensifer adhaerens TaxID=106592 RepID=UPI0012E81CF8|nr:DUF4334 domain-containing protein [Ensifer adhaerens]